MKPDEYRIISASSSELACPRVVKLEMTAADMQLQLAMTADQQGSVQQPAAPTDQAPWCARIEPQSCPKFEMKAAAGGVHAS